MKRVAILASYNGSGFKALYRAAKSLELDLDIVLVISNNSTATVLQSACEFGIKSAVVNSKTDLDPDKKIEQLLRECECDYLFLSGYMKKLSKNITTNFRVVNCHPSLLPKYGGEGMYGRFVHEAVIKNREKRSGVTIHEVDENYDEGKIVLQKELLLSEGESAESLETKIKELEQTTIIEAFRVILALS
jgi:phosphoribosylglycinamide formyltransferase-1